MSAPLSDKHSPALYKLDEAVSALRVSVRTCQPSRAQFWASQLLLGGEIERLVVKILPQMASEDVGFGWGLLMQECHAIHQSWIAKRTECVAHVLSLVARMALSFKSRMVVSAASVMENNILDGTELEALAETMGAAMKQREERRSLELAHCVYVAVRQIEDKKAQHATWKQAWAVVRSLPVVGSPRHALTESLYLAHQSVGLLL